MKRKMLLISFGLMSAAALSLTLISTTSAATGTNASLKDVIVSNMPDIFKAREQNIDEDGNIKVHEKGIAKVEITNPKPVK